MWSCQKCGKPVYFAERKQSMGFSWHPDCLRCEECGKRLNPGQHAEHKGSPFCHVPCYSALFGPQLFGHGSKVESHSSFGKGRVAGPNVNKSHLESKVKLYNRVWEGKRGELNVREVNGRLVLEGVLRIYWAVSQEIYLKEDDDRRVWVQVKKRQSYRQAMETPVERRASDADVDAPVKQAIAELPEEGNRPTSLSFNSLPPAFDIKAWKTAANLNADEDGSRTLPGRLSVCSLPEETSVSAVDDDDGDGDVRGRDPALSQNADDEEDEDLAARVAKVNLRRRPGRRMVRSPLKRRKSMINGHCYDVSTSAFTPPRGCVASVWVSSLVNTSEVINMLLEKYRVQCPAENFGLFAVWDNGEQRELKRTAFPLHERVMLGPHEDVVKIFIMDRDRGKDIPAEVAQYLKFSFTELSMFIEAFYDEEEREVARLQSKYRHDRFILERRMREELRKMKSAAESGTACVKL